MVISTEREHSPSVIQIGVPSEYQFFVRQKNQLKPTQKCYRVVKRKTKQRPARHTTKDI